MDFTHPTTSITSTTKRLEGKVAIVTGGASGIIGASTVRLFTENGAKVIIADIDNKAGQSLAEELGSSVSFVHCDVSVEDQVRSLVDTTIAEHDILDVMFNNAGVLDRFGGYSIFDTTGPELDRVLGVNLCGAFYGAKHAARVMTPRKRGCILFTGSTCQSPIGGVVSHPYVMSKYGIMGLVKNLSGELGEHGIRVNCISPSAVNTAIRPFAGVRNQVVEEFIAENDNNNINLLTPQSVARAALYLASDDGAYVSGHNLVLDAGIFDQKSI